MLPKTTITGRLASDATIKTFANNFQVLTAHVITSKKYYDNNNQLQEVVSPFFVVIRGPRAASALNSNLLKKGNTVAFECEIVSRSYIDNGRTVWTTDFIVDQWQFCGYPASHYANVNNPMQHPTQMHQDQYQGQVAYQQGYQAPVQQPQIPLQQQQVFTPQATVVDEDTPF